VNIEHRAFLKLKLEMRAENGYRPSYGAVFEQLQYFENSSTGNCCPAQGVLARALGYCRETVNRATRWLELHGYIRTQQRYKRFQRGGCRYLSKRYWIARELGQVAFLLGKLAEQGMAAFLAGKPIRLPARFSCDPKPAVPSRTEFNSDLLMSPGRFQPPDGGK
jgi:DNA-binding transcriptional MocR family regulator